MCYTTMLSREKWLGRHQLICQNDVSSRNRLMNQGNLGTGIVTGRFRKPGRDQTGKIRTLLEKNLNSRERGKKYLFYEKVT